MREIKFRAWQKEVKGLKKEKMIDFETISKSWTFYEFLNPEKNGRILMQFTGLHDKNGKEIYEWDILHCFTKTDSYPHLGKVVFINSAYAIEVGENIDGNMEYSLLLHNENFEIIGNIYENPKLIKP